MYRSKDYEDKIKRVALLEPKFDLENVSYQIE